MDLESPKDHDEDVRPRVSRFGSSGACDDDMGRLTNRQCSVLTGFKEGDGMG